VVFGESALVLLTDTVKVLPLGELAVVNQFPLPLWVETLHPQTELIVPDEAVTVTVEGPAFDPGPGIVNATGFGLNVNVCAFAVSGLPSRATAAKAKIPVKQLNLRNFFLHR
jgi:hypothetical protein